MARDAEVISIGADIGRHCHTEQVEVALANISRGTTQSALSGGSESLVNTVLQSCRYGTCTGAEDKKDQLCAMPCVDMHTTEPRQRAVHQEIRTATERQQLSHQLQSGVAGSRGSHLMPRVANTTRRACQRKTPS